MYANGYSKVFFDGTSTQSYFSTIHQKMKDEVEEMNNTTIVSCDFQEWADYLSNKYYIPPILIFETNVEPNLIETPVKKANPFHHFPYEPEYYEVDGVCVTFTIPFDGEPDLFDLRPSTIIFKRFATQCFIKPLGEKCGSFTLDFQYSKQELQEQGDSMKDYVQKKFEHEFESYKSMIDSVNNDVAAYNNQLTDYVMQLLNERKKKADSFSAISNALQIPLRVSDNAPNTTPIQLKRITRKPLTKPETKAQHYSTWHDAKVSVIIFNKKNQSFPPILKKITEWADANAKSHIQPKPNVWKCKYYRQDMNMDIQLTILAFDLYVDRTQFKDSRY